MIRAVALVALALIALPAAAQTAGVAPSAAPESAAVTKVRFYPAPGKADKLVKGRFSGSNTGPTNDFQTIVQITEAPAADGWTELTVEKPEVFRYVKFESPNDGWGNIAEVEFYAGDTKLTGEPFGTNGSRDDSGNTFDKALDGDTATYFEGVSPIGQYVGIDLGESVQTATPALSPAETRFDGPTELTLSTATPNATIRYSTNGTTPNREHGDTYKGPFTVDKSAVVIAIAYRDDLAVSVPLVQPVRIGSSSGDEKAVRTFHIGNSLTDTVNGYLEPVAESAGREMHFHRFTIPGAPTDWLWNHPGSGFGDSRYVEAFEAYAPIDHLFTQPFAGHGRSIENEAEHSGNFFDAARQFSPDIQPWLYVQWPGKDLKDSWAKGEGAVKELNLKPATTWQEGVANHMAYTEAVRELMDSTHEGKPVRIVPAGAALAQLKTEVDAGQVPGMTDFFAGNFADDLHLSPAGRYLVALVHYACIYQESPEGKVSPTNSGLTEEQAEIYQRIAWDVVKDYEWAKTE